MYKYTLKMDIESYCPEMFSFFLAKTEKGLTERKLWNLILKIKKSHKLLLPKFEIYIQEIQECNFCFDNPIGDKRLLRTYTSNNNNKNEKTFILDNNMKQIWPPKGTSVYQRTLDYFKGFKKVK
ncbi:MAG: hypothetical protein JW974_03790 [Alphaproteobacteria bacterium]|nr:hypothetical protein [Alphaproteobacteria bacterium]MBN2675358.1 hypothetical protein [Alphaproteobacteria bacterium]